ncbi:MAG: diguanylate cyclase, partial [Thiohalocapsa sp.]
IEAHPFDLGSGQALRVTVSIGVATRRPSESMEALIRRADEALYAAKNNGRNQVCLATDPPAG